MLRRRCCLNSIWTIGPVGLESPDKLADAHAAVPVLRELLVHLSLSQRPRPALALAADLCWSLSGTTAELAAEAVLSLVGLQACQLIVAGMHPLSCCEPGWKHCEGFEVLIPQMQLWYEERAAV